jgi:hypothetical protein
MAQHDYNIANQGFPAFRSDLNNALSAIQTTNSGTSRPSGAVAGQLWLDTTTATSPTLKYYDGADDISLATIDHTTNTVNWLDSTVSITGLTTTATGTVLTLSDTATTSTVNLIIDNQKEIRFRETTANGTNYVSLKAPASLSADLTFTLPTADGTNGQVLTTNGSGVLSFATPASGIAWQSSVKTTGFTATAGEGYFCNTTSAGFTVTLPATPTAGQQVALVDYAGTFDTNALIISPNGGKIEGGTSNSQLTGEREGVLLVYIDSTQGWLATSGINEGTDALSKIIYSVDFLVVAGGAGGGSLGGGGGAGGYRTSTQSVEVGTVITVTVGDGGAGGTEPSKAGVAGSNSSISGSGLTTITSAGGGAGGAYEAGGGNGGSGGGTGSQVTSAGGLGNTPSTSPSQGNNGGAGNNSAPNYGAGGGGGASAVGVNATSSSGGNGGAGTASSITGSSVTRAGGGGGATNGGGTAGSGGSGGGGAGTNSSTTATSGTVNTGGGGGGGGYSQPGGPFSNGGAGGKGVVILSVPTASYSSTTTGSPTVTTSGSNTILQFNGSGSYTA